MDEMTFYNHEEVVELASTISVSVTDAFKYIYSNYANQANAEDFKYFEDEKLRAAFRLLRDSCLDFISAYDYYNFTATTPYPADKDCFEVIMERTKAYKKELEENHDTILAYNELSNYYDLIEE